jgi:hypothetical protein
MAANPPAPSTPENPPPTGHLWLNLAPNGLTLTYGATGTEHNSAAARHSNDELLWQLQYTLEVSGVDLSRLINFDGGSLTPEGEYWSLRFGDNNPITLNQAGVKALVAFAAREGFAELCERWPYDERWVIGSARLDDRLGLSEV